MNMKNAYSKKTARALRELTASDLDKIAGGIVATGNPPPTEPTPPG